MIKELIKLQETFDEYYDVCIQREQLIIEGKIDDTDDFVTLEDFSEEWEKMLINKYEQIPSNLKFS